MPEVPFAGVIPPVITPFTSGGEVDYASLANVVNHLIDGGCHGLFPLGSTGEVAYLTDSQRVAIVEKVVEVAAGRVPVVVGCMETTALRVIEQAERAVAAGADAIVATAPFYARNSRDEIADHFRMIRARVDVPIFAYDIPVRINGVKLDAALLVELGKEGVIHGVKDSSGDDVGFRRLVAANEAAGHPLTLLTGHEVMVDGMLLLGADGVVPGYGNVDPRGYSQLWEAAQKGDWAQARKVQDSLAAGFEIVFVPRGRSGDASGVGAFKTACKLLGVIATNEMAPPVKPLGSDDEAAVAKLLRDNGLLG